MWAPGGRISAALGAEWAELGGRDVADNHRYQFSGSLAYDLRPEGFDYLRVGPLLQYSAYQRNLRHFTYGHGGYCSPQRNLQWGLLAPHLIVGAYAAVSSAPGYDHAHAGVMLRVTFEPRSSLVSADLPFADPRTRR